MSFLLRCPQCGSRPVGEFAYRGEPTAEIVDGMDPRTVHRIVHLRRNVAGPQREWWMHRAGCQRWFVAERDTTTNVVLRTGLASELAPEASA